MEVEPVSGAEKPQTVEEIKASILARLRTEKERLARMPAASKYVVHRLRVIKRAEEILASDDAVAGEAEDELMALLQKLSL